MIVDQISIDLSIFNLLYFQSIIVLIQVEHYPLIGTTITNKIQKGEEGLVIHTSVLGRQRSSSSAVVFWATLIE